jgi:dihydroorotate dehydrogenase
MASLGPKPLLVKIAPDITTAELEAIVKVVSIHQLSGLVVANTTTNRALMLRAAFLDRGGLSGMPLFPRTLELVKQARALLGREAILIASGGIFTGADVARFLASGADLIEVYTAFVYRGPRCANLVCRELLTAQSKSNIQAA